MKLKDLNFMEKCSVFIATMMFVFLFVTMTGAITSSMNTDNTNKVSKLYYMCVTEMSPKWGNVNECDNLE